MASNLFDLKGKVAAVTGGNGGIGLGMAKGMAAAGAAVAVVGRNKAKSEKAINELQALGAKAEFVAFDALDEKSCKDAIHSVAQKFGRLDILVNNATNVSQGGFFAMTEETWDRAFDHKLRGTIRCIQHAVPAMRERSWGRIINIAGGAAWARASTGTRWESG